MSFSPDWLALREPVDHAARNGEVAGLVARHFVGRGSVRVVDIGCGTGSNLRGMAALLPPQQHWCLVDYDPVLLAAAEQALIGWAQRAEKRGEQLVLDWQGRRIIVERHRIDLNADLPAIMALKPDLVTAAAFFDLVSRPWLERFVPMIAAKACAFYTTLTYNGVEDWLPPHAADAAMLAAFAAHQGGDKGFGDALGPQAHAVLRDLFRAHGYRCAEGVSPWWIDAANSDLKVALAEGSAAAVRETGRVDAALLEDWLAARLRHQGACSIGHDDLFAVPT